MTERRELDPALTSLPRIFRYEVPAVFELCSECDQYHLGREDPPVERVPEPHCYICGHVCVLWPLR